MIVQFAEKVILAGGFVGAVVAMGAFMIKVYKFIRAWEKWIEEKDRHDKENYLSIQQLKIMSPYMPLSERIKAGEIYINNGGNGEIRFKYNELVEELLMEEEFFKNDTNCTCE